jgi:hypothetical protein
VSATTAETTAATEATTPTEAAPAIAAAVSIAATETASIATSEPITTAEPVATISIAAVVTKAYAKSIGVAIVAVWVSIRISIRIRRIAVRGIRSAPIVSARVSGIASLTARVWWRIAVGLTLVCISLVLVARILL